MYKQQMLRYAHREEDIATIAEAIDLLGKGDSIRAIDILMGYRNRLQEMQQPELLDYDQRSGLG